MDCPRSVCSLRHMRWTMIALPNLTKQEVVETLNILLEEGKVDLLKQGTTCFYKISSEAKSSHFKGLGPEERLIRQLIEESGNLGISVRELTFKTKMTASNIKRILKMMQQRQMVKSQQSIAATNKTVYLMWDVDPSEKVKGNNFFSDGVFDSVFVEVLNEQCEKFIASKGWTTLEEISRFIQTSGVSKVELKPEEIKAIVQTLIYDGKVEEIKDTRDPEQKAPSFLYKPSKLSLPRNGLTEVPCGQCPVSLLVSS